jgi:hypothetical protein
MKDKVRVYPQERQNQAVQAGWLRLHSVDFPSRARRVPQKCSICRIEENTRVDTLISLESDLV